MLLTACGAETNNETTAAVETTSPTIADAENYPGDWLAHGRTWSEQRFSPLEKINTESVSNLSLAWYIDLPESRGQEASPIIVDGVMYTTAAWSVVYALDARTGEELWRYDPEVDRAHAVNGCCDAVNRGVAWWEDRVIVGTLDGRLIAIDTKTGEELWSVLTIDLS